ncbi:MAG: hypothetical protein WCU83_02910 [Bacteroidia bacterium]
MHGVFFGWAVTTGNIYLKDSFEYLHQAGNLWKYGSWYAAEWNGPLLPEMFSFRPPLYAAFIGFIKQFIDSDYAVLLVQNGISIYTLIQLYLLLEKYVMQAKSAQWMIPVCLVFFPTQLVMANMIMSEILFQFLLMQTFVCTFQWTLKPGWKSSLYLSGWLCLLILTKPVGLLLPVVVLLLQLYRMYKRDWTGAKFLIPLLLVLLVFHLTGLQQKHQTGFYHYTSMKAFNQYKFNARFILASKFGEEYAEHWSDSCKKVFTAQPDYASRYHFMHAAGDAVIREYPVEFVKLLIRGGIVFFVDPGRHDLAVFFGWSDHRYTGLFYELNAKGFPALVDWIRQIPVAQVMWLALIFLFNLVMAGIIIVYFYRSAIPALIKWMLLIWIVYICVATGILGVARYRSAIYPELLMVFLTAVQTMINNRKFTKKHV